MMQSGVVWMYFMLVHIMCTVMYKMNLSSWKSEADILNCKKPCSNQLIQVNVTGSTLYQNRNTMNNE